MSQGEISHCGEFQRRILGIALMAQYDGVANVECPRVRSHDGPGRAPVATNNTTIELGSTPPLAMECCTAISQELALVHGEASCVGFQTDARILK